MMLTASKFDPINDADRPVVYSAIDAPNGPAVIRRVEFCLTSKMIEHLRAGTQPFEFIDCDDVLIRQHAKRPGVQWGVGIDYGVPCPAGCVDGSTLVPKNPADPNSCSATVDCPRCGGSGVVPA